MSFVVSLAITACTRCWEHIWFWLGSKLRNIVAKQRAQVPIAAAGHWQTWTQRCAQFWQSAHLLHADAGGSIHWGLLRFTQSQPGSLIAHVCRSADLEQPSSLSDRDSTA